MVQKKQKVLSVTEKLNLAKCLRLPVKNTVSGSSSGHPTVSDGIQGLLHLFRNQIIMAVENTESARDHYRRIQNPQQAI